MLGHLGLNVADLETAKRYYDDILPMLGFEEYFATDDQFAYRPAGGKPGTFLFFYEAEEDGDYSRRRTGLQHLAFMVPTRSAVHAAHDRARASGNEILHAPREFPEYPPPHYFATFWLDLFGFMIEVVCHHDRD